MTQASGEGPVSSSEPIASFLQWDWSPVDPRNLLEVASWYHEDPGFRASALFSNHIFHSAKTWNINKDSGKTVSAPLAKYSTLVMNNRDTSGVGEYEL